MADFLTRGARQAVRNCLRVREGEKVVIITDRETRPIGEALHVEANSASSREAAMFVMEDFGPRPADGKEPLPFPDAIGGALEQAGVSIFAARSKKNELQSFRIPMLDLIEANRRLRHAHMPDIDEEIMGMGMALDYEKVQRLSAEVYETVKDASEVRVATPAGTELTVYMSSDFRWVKMDGLIGPGRWSNLPEGEVFTCAGSVRDGSVVVVDGVLGDYFDREYGKLDSTPLYISLRNSRVERLECDNKKLLQDLSRYLEQDSYASRLAEFAVGTGAGLDRLIGNLLQDEKFPGVHVAFGHGYPNLTGCNWESEAHVDCVMQSCSVWVDGRQIMDRGRFLIEY